MRATEWNVPQASNHSFGSVYTRLLLYTAHRLPFAHMDLSRLIFDDFFWQAMVSWCRAITVTSSSSYCLV